jgi:G3E family GTPase
MSGADARLPVAVLTGFLGAGKTTLLNFLLRHPQMAGTAVVINEYGEVGLDHHLIEAAADEVELIAGGCLCCTVRGRLAEALLRLRARNQRGELPTIRRIVLETTGLAEPGPILRELSAPELAEHFRIEGTTTLVDAVNGPQTLDRQPIARAQVAAADHLLISKADLVNAAAGEALQQRLRALNPEAEISTVRRGAAQPRQLFGGRRASAGPAFQQWFQAAEPVRFRPFSDDSPSPAAQQIDSFSLVLDAPLPESRFYGWLAFLRSLCGPELLRIKGLVHLEGQPGPTVLHGVQGVFHPPEVRADWPDADRRTRLVFITQGWGKETVRSTLNYLQDPDAPAP